jgi:hypothetical protein
MPKHKMIQEEDHKMDISKVEALGAEALDLAKAMLRNEYNQAQSISAVNRIEQIIVQIGGSARELISNAETAIKAELLEANQ